MCVLNCPNNHHSFGHLPHVRLNPKQTLNGNPHQHYIRISSNRTKLRPNNHPPPFPSRFPSPLPHKPPLRLKLAEYNLHDKRLINHFAWSRL